jgi:hypothetical protein
LTQEILVKGVKKVGFSIMREDWIPIKVVKDLNLVFPKTPRGTKVEVARVFIPKGAMAYFSPLAPVCCAKGIRLTKGFFSEVPKAGFKNGERARFFQAINQGDGRATVLEVDGRELTITWKPFDFQVVQPNKLCTNELMFDFVALCFLLLLKSYKSKMCECDLVTFFTTSSILQSYLVFVVKQYVYNH